MDAVSAASDGGHVEPAASPLRVMALRRSYANRKSISASEADDVESVRRRHPSVESKYRSSDVSGAYVAKASLCFLLIPNRHSVFSAFIARPFVKRFALCYWSVGCPVCLSCL